MIKGIAHLCIRVADLGRTARFYCQGLGLEKAFDFRRDDKTVGFYLKAGNLLSVNAPIQACARRTSPQRRASLP